MEEMEQRINEEGEEYEGDDDALYHEGDCLAEPGGEAAEAPVEPVEEAVDPAEDARPGGRPLFQKHCAHRRAQCERGETGDGDGDNDGDGELLVKLPRGPRQEGGGYKDGGHDEDDRDERAADLLHRLDGRLLRREATLLHVPLDVLDDDDGVVDHHAYGEHDAEEGQEVEGEAEGKHAGESADEGDNYRRDADDRRAEALEEEVDDEDDQEDRLEERVDDLVDGDPHEIGRVEGHHVLDAFRHRRLQLLHCLADRRRDLEAVRSRLLVDR